MPISLLCTVCEKWVYPEDSPFIFYRGGTVALGCKMLNFGMYLAVVLIASQPMIMAAAVRHVAATTVPFVMQSHWHAFLFPVLVGCGTCLLYHLNAVRLDKKGGSLWATPEGRAYTKTQPGKDLDPRLRAECVRLGNFNAFLTGFVGSGLVVVHLCYCPWVAPVSQSELEEHGTTMFLRDVLLTYLWIDFSAYCLHRLLHSRSLYWLHKSHHRYTVPCAHAAFAAHPIDFLVFELLGMTILVFVRIHPFAFALAAMPTAYHNQVEHCGIAFSGEMPWTPTPLFHDDHHSQFTCNFGFELCLWDWAFGTLRRKKNTYGDPLQTQLYHDDF